MPEFPSFKGRIRHEEYDTAEFGTGMLRFTVKAYGPRNLLFMLKEARASLDYAIADAEAAVRKEEAERCTRI